MKEVVKNFFEIKEQYDQAFILFKKEVNRIVIVITDFCDRRQSWWTFEFTEGLIDLPPQKIENGNMIIHINQQCIVGESFYHQGFPAIFFEMTDKEIYNYLEREKNLHIKKTNAIPSKIEQSSIVKNALAKLTEKEKKALNLD